MAMSAGGYGGRASVAGRWFAMDSVISQEALDQQAPCNMHLH